MIGHAAESLERLDAAIAALPRRARLPAEAASLRVVRAMGALEAPPALPQPAVLEQVRARLAAGGTDGKDIALAPWVLWNGDPAAVGFSGLLDRVVADASRRRRTLRHLIESWIKDFRLDALRIADAGLAIERLLAGGANDRLDLWRGAHARYRMFDASTGPEEIARDLIDGNRSPADILAATGLDDETRGIGGYMHVVHDLCLTRVAAALAGREVDRKFERAGAILASGGRLRFPEARGEIARKLLLPWRDGQAGPGAEAKQLVQAFLLRHIGHPQLEPRAWIAIDPEADIVRRWLAQASLEVFFGLIAEHALDSQWSYREAFWSACLRKGAIADAWLVLGPQVFASARARRGLGGAYALLEKPYSPDQSVLLMRVGPLVVGEWSHNGKLWAWQPNRAPTLYRPHYAASALRRGGLEFPSDPLNPRQAPMPGLAHLGAANGVWQRRAAALLARHAGVVLKPSDWRLP